MLAFAPHLKNNENAVNETDKGLKSNSFIWDAVSELQHSPQAKTQLSFWGWNVD